MNAGAEARGDRIWRMHATRCLLGLSLLLPVGLLAQSSGGGLSIVRSSIDGGGRFSMGTTPYTVSGTIGQPLAGTLSAPGVELHGGFRSPSTSAVTERIFADSFEPAP